MRGTQSPPHSARLSPDPPRAPGNMYLASSMFGERAVPGSPEEVHARVERLRERDASRASAAQSRLQLHDQAVADAARKVNGVRVSKVDQDRARSEAKRKAAEQKAAADKAKEDAKRLEEMTSNEGTNARPVHTTRLQLRVSL